jgi:hypothetical protein
MRPISDAPPSFVTIGGKSRSEHFTAHGNRLGKRPQVSARLSVTARWDRVGKPRLRRTEVFQRLEVVLEQTVETLRDGALAIQIFALAPQILNSDR